MSCLPAKSHLHDRIFSYLSSHTCLLWPDAPREGTRKSCSRSAAWSLSLQMSRFAAYLSVFRVGITSATKWIDCVQILSCRNSSCPRTTTRWPRRAHTRVRQGVRVHELMWCANHIKAFLIVFFNCQRYFCVKKLKNILLLKLQLREFLILKYLCKDRPQWIQSILSINST